MSKSESTLTWDEAMLAARLYVLEHEGTLERAAVGGSVLRRKRLVHDVDLLVIPAPGVQMTHTQRLAPLNVFATSRECWEPALMQYAPDSGSVIGTRARAKTLGYKLNQYGLFRVDDGTLVSRSAQDICELIGARLSQWVARSLAGDLLLVPSVEKRAVA